jgi:hypothetical protein
VRLVGFNRELEPKSAFASGSIRDAVASVAGGDEARIAEYLEAGYGIIDYTESGYDVLGSGAINVACSSLVSDGEWVWRNDLAFYVRRYHLRLADEFVEHVRANDCTMPAEDISKLMKRTEEFHSLGG